MRFGLTRAAVVGLGLSLAACAAPPQQAYNNGFTGFALGLGVDPQDAAGRAVEGAVLGATLGAALGATFAINPGLGATIGTEAGGALGAAVGVATGEPLPHYAPIAIPTAAIKPGFYDSWPPGYIPPPNGTLAPPPPPHPG